MAEFGYSNNHAGIIADERRKTQLEGEGKTPCERCEGTGNELYAMYKRCRDCGGSGEDPHKRCPDGGVCHHSCGEMCWRVSTCCPLSDVFPNDEWPEKVKAQHVADYEGDVVDCAWVDYPSTDTRIGEQGDG